MKKLLLTASLALGLTACFGRPPHPCLGKGETGKILEVEEVDRGRDVPYNIMTTLRVTTDNKTVRICRAYLSHTTMLKAGDIITGYDNETQSGLGYDWFRVR